MQYRTCSSKSDEDPRAVLEFAGREHSFVGRWIAGSPWQRFGRYDHYVVLRDDGAVEEIPAHAGELVPGSTEDLVEVVRRYDKNQGHPLAPMTLELDPTYRCTSKDCGGRCFSYSYRRLAPGATISVDLLRTTIDSFAHAGGRIVRFDGGGDPLSHESVRNGELPERANQLGLKTTILTSGDLLPQSDLQRIADARCYLRVSLNAATEQTRQHFHGNSISLGRILSRMNEFITYSTRRSIDVPVAVTFLLDVMNFSEVKRCAEMCRDVGVSHFSVRRVLGPDSLRPDFQSADIEESSRLLNEVADMNCDSFRTFVPWRPLDEPDLAANSRSFGNVSRCWQSTFKVVVEPSPDTNGLRAQLCGRYRGNGIGQLMQLPSLFETDDGSGWVDQWRDGFSTYSLSRESLPSHCRSCIDRGFIVLVDRLVEFAHGHDFEILHLDSCRAAYCYA